MPITEDRARVIFGNEIDAFTYRRACRAKSGYERRFGERLGQRSGIFDRLVWEPMNSEGFRRLSYNAADQKASELMCAPFADLPRDVPFVGTHAWPSQAAVHAGLEHVVNAIPDNWPMALHLAE